MIHRELDEPLAELGRLACLQGFVALARGDRDSATRAMARAQAMADETGVAAGSRLVLEIARLQEALTDRGRPGRYRSRRSKSR